MQPLHTIECGSLFIYNCQTFVRLDFAGCYSICRRVVKTADQKWTMVGCDEFIHSELGVYSFIEERFVTELEMIS